jgi:hypothetical protein
MPGLSDRMPPVFFSTRSLKILRRNLSKIDSEYATLSSEQSETSTKPFSSTTVAEEEVVVAAGSNWG